MILPLTIAALFLCLSAALFFGPQLVAYGWPAVGDMARAPEARFIAGTLATATAFLLITPLASEALISGGQTVQVVATEIMGMSFG